MLWTTAEISSKTEIRSLVPYARHAKGNTHNLCAVSREFSVILLGTLPLAHTRLFIHPRTHTHTHAHSLDSTNMTERK